MSAIHYKFKSAKDYQSVTFEGNELAVVELKALITQQKKLGKALDTDLCIYNAQTGEEYKGEQTRIPRNTSVEVKRIPVMRPRIYQHGGSSSTEVSAATHAGAPSSGASKFGVSAYNPMRRPMPFNSTPGAPHSQHGQGASHSNYNGFRSPGGHPHHGPAFTPVTMPTLQAVPGSTTEAASDPAAASNTESSEQDRLRAMFSQATRDWQQAPGPGQSNRFNHYQQQYNSNNNNNNNNNNINTGAPQSSFSASPDGRGGKGQFHYAMMNKPPPVNYTCFRCGQKGHFIQHCPTNDNPAFDMPRTKKTTGIPKSFLQKVEHTPGETLVGKQGLMMNQDGSYVVATANDYMWNKASATIQTYNLAAATQQLLQDAEPPYQESDPTSF